jgi:hypothetical protein
MPPNKPLFSVGNAVFEKFAFASASRERGRVIEAYELDDQYRYVVKFESGREEIFFENELIADRSKPD